MLSRTTILVLFAVLWNSCLCAAAAAQQDAPNRFELKGTVINSVSGEGISGALVQGYFPERKVQFSGSDGTFAFVDVPRGRYAISARKPGFFNEQELGHWNAGFNLMKTVPADSDVIVRLTPEAIIYGEVTGEDGTPAEGITVKAERWQTQGGQRRLEAAGSTATDDEGNFRISELRPGTYYLRFESVSRGGWRNYSELQANNVKEQGYGTEYYPGAADRASASAIVVRAGAQVHIAQIMSKQRLFEVSGVVRGAHPDFGVNLNLSNEEGETAQRSVHFDAKTGEFQIPGIPPGTYVLTATGWRPRRNGIQPQTETLSTELPLHVNSDISGLILTLGTVITAGIVVHDERSHGAPSNNGSSVSVQMNSKEFPQFSQGVAAPAPGGLGRPARISGLIPGTYSVQAAANQGGYIAALTCGDVNLLHDDLTVAPGVALPPIEVTLRDDGAQLNLTVIENGAHAAANVVIFSEENPKTSLLVRTGIGGDVSIGGIAPGNYELIALKDAEELEFRNPVVMQKYVDQAGTVSLGPGDKVSMKVEMQKEDGEQ
jgi:Carboxypeptidase regulatory-like domain